ncbi:MAG: SelT/SelW/SelH family protein [Desulfobulbaceae bacterium]|nr:SelT/SelW/SelH family protein [Desulfobulbaceae bacterium]
MGEEIKKQLAAEVELTPGTGGVFKVMVGDRLVFSRKQEGGFAATEEIINRLRELQ